MTPISLQKAAELLDTAAAVVVNYVVTYPQIEEIREPDDKWLSISWDDEEGTHFHIRFNERANPRIHGGKLVLTDTGGDDTEITLLQVWRLKDPDES